MDSASSIEELSNDESSFLGADIDIHTIDNDAVGMEILFKAWIHNSGTDKKHVHFLLSHGLSARFPKLQII